MTDENKKIEAEFLLNEMKYRRQLLEEAKGTSKNFKITNILLYLFATVFFVLSGFKHEMIDALLGPYLFMLTATVCNRTNKQVGALIKLIGEQKLLKVTEK